MNSEIHLNEEFGYNIFQTVLKFQLKYNLEIGSWDGEGSTKCFFEAMKLLSGEKSLVCVEIVKEKYNKLKARYENFDFVNCFNGSSISYSDLLYKSFEDVWCSPYNKLQNNHYSKETVKSWYDRDVETMKTNVNFLNANDQTFYDSVLIDGSEFTGYSEFKLLENRTKIFFLDDVHCAFKCNQIFNELISNPNWSLILELPNCRNGSAIFIKNV
jgi:hypothetical protein